MKQTRSLINGLVGSAVALAIVSSVMAQTGGEGHATVIRKKGAARYTTGSGQWQPLEVGAVLKPGAVVQTSTEKGSFVDLALGAAQATVPAPVKYQPYIPTSYAVSASFYQPSAEQNVVRVWENSALGIDKLTEVQTGADTVTDTQLDLKAGRIAGSVKKMSAASKYEIKLPNGVAGIRGTVYEVTAEGNMKILVGSGVMAWVDPKTGNVTTQVVVGGQNYNAPTGQITPLGPEDTKALTAFGTGMHSADPDPMMLASDRTVHEVSPHGPPFNPPGPPPIIPPRGHGVGP
jgi:hypothetical protein